MLTLVSLQFSAVVLVLDVGLTSNSSGFLDHAMICVNELLQRKLMSESTDRFGLVLVGTDKSDNPLKYQHVALLDRPLAQVDWELMEYIGSHVKGKTRVGILVNGLLKQQFVLTGTSQESDWLDGVVVALHFLKENTDSVKACTGRKIVLISDVGCPANESNLDIIITNLERENVEFMFL